MNPETINAIKEALTPIAAKIGQGAEFGWDVVLKQQWIKGLTYFIWAGFALLVTSVFIWFAILCHKKFIKSQDSDDWVFRNFMAIFASISAAVLFGLLTDGIQHLLNPAYYALDFFIHLGSTTQ